MENREQIIIKNEEFTFHLLNDTGKKKALEIAACFDHCLDSLKFLCGKGESFKISKMYLEQACFFAKKSMASDPDNHISKNAI